MAAQVKSRKVESANLQTECNQATNKNNNKSNSSMAHKSDLV